MDNDYIMIKSFYQTLLKNNQNDKQLSLYLIINKY